MQLDLPTGEGMQQCFDHLGPVDAVINCAAISSPAACEKEEQIARSVSLILHNIHNSIVHSLDLMLMRLLEVRHCETYVHAVITRNCPFHLSLYYAQACRGPCLLLPRQRS